MNFVYQDVNSFDPTSEGREQIFDLEVIAQSLSNLFSTRKGEIPFNPDYGVSLEDSLFEIIDDVSALSIFREVTEAVVSFEPRIRLSLSETKVVADVDSGTYTLTVVGFIVGKDDMKFEFEGTLES